MNSFLSNEKLTWLFKPDRRGNTFCCTNEMITVCLNIKSAEDLKRLQILKRLEQMAGPIDQNNY